MRKTTKFVVTILLILLVSSMASMFTGCNKDSTTIIELILVDIKTGKTYSSGLAEDRYVRVKLEEFDGFELKYKYKDKYKYLPDKQFSLVLLESLTRYLIYDSEGIVSEVQKIDWPKEKGNYHYNIRFNDTYYNEATGQWVESIEKFNSIIFILDLTVE